APRNQLQRRLLISAAQAPASEVSIYQYSGVVFTAVFSYAFLGETLSKSSIIGGIVILGAIFWVFENTRKEKNT
uniref:DMT family transporter n=1 Tax=Dysosmobacter welbionis TaxID=2093857 RepID=UPI00307A6D34